MKTHILSLLAVATVTGINAQTTVEPLIIAEAYAQKMNNAGTAFMAQDIAGNAIMYDFESGDELWYGGYYPGNGNCIADNGMLVGQDMETSRAAIMKEFVGEVPSSFTKYVSSSLDGITPDASRACGWVQNPKGGPTVIPVYCDIAEDGSVGEVQQLPYPPKDFFNDTPQFCTAVSISNDGKTIAGVVQDATGFYTYPIVYKQDQSGEWSYTCPSQPMFNPEHLEIPKFPDFNNVDFPKQPQITDFMTPEKQKEWEEDMAQYEETGDADMNPWSYVEYFTGEEGYKEFEKAIVEYNREVNNIMDTLLDDYWKNMAKVGKYACFIPNMALSPIGDILVADLGIKDEELTTDTFSGYATYRFNLTDGSYSLLDSDNKNLIPTQILSDGTIVTVSSASDELPFNSYLLLPETTEFISIEDYLKSTDSTYLPWMVENLDLLGTGVISGLVSLSDNKSSMVGGLPLGDMMSYVISLNNASVGSIMESEDNIYNVYTLNGLKVLSSKEKSDLNSLPTGIYIINGKKIKL